MDKNSYQMIRSIKSRIIAMLEERQRLENKEVSFASPSRYWSDFCSFFDYMLGLPEESFSKLRLHTYHLTTDNYQIYYFGVDAEPFKAYWRELIKDIPPSYIIYEPDGGIGFSLDNGKIVSHDILRFQYIIKTFYRYGIIFSILSIGQERKFILEIGAGYGGLAHHLSNILENVTYIIVDLPETLLFSASYLSLHNPNKRIYVYENSNFAELVQADHFRSYDFVLIPNYKLDELRRVGFDLVINIASLQEMTADQVNTYLDFIEQTCRGVFYSSNQDVQPRNGELANLSDMIRARFDITEVSVGRLPGSLVRRDGTGHKFRRVLKSAAISLGLWNRPAESFPYPPFREWICKPLRNKNIE